MIQRSRRRAAATLAALIALVACGGDDAAGPVTLRLLTYDSFPTEGTSLNDALATFTDETGIGVELVIAGDAGTMVSKAVLTAGNPEGDVLWGIDNTLLSRALAADVFDPYESSELGTIDPALTALVPEADVTPVDSGEVCLNYDIAWFAERDLEPPATFADLLEPDYADLLVVQNPASSSPGLAFLLATVAEFGEGGWKEYWRGLRANGVEVADSWTTAYYERFSGSGGGDRPIVVSYATSPPAEVIYADPPRDDAPTATIVDTCFQQVEFAGVLRGTDHPDEARALIDFLVSSTFQQEIALNLFVYPARADVELPEVFVRFSGQVTDPRTLPPDAIAAGQQQWTLDWTEIVLR